MAVRVRIQNFQSIEDCTVVIDGLTVITGPNNSGKALRDGTLVATPTGWVAVETLRVGDLVLAGDGSPTEVLGVFPQGERATTIIEFDDGREAVVDADHLWKVSIGSRRFPKSEQQWEILSTADILARVGKIPTRYQRPAIPSPGPARYESREVPIDPYVLGVLLGDGCMRPESVRISSADVEIVSEVQALLPSGMSLIEAGGCDYRLTYSEWQRNPILEAVRAMALAGKKAHEKEIPEDYLYNAVESRVALLQGLMDTDGTVNQQGIPEFCSTSKALAEGVREIVLSLGGAARIRNKVPTYTHQGEVKQGRRAYTVTFRLPGFNPFRLPRKAERVGALSRRVQPLMVGFRQGEASPCTCIEVAHPDQTFQMEGHLVTHNTAVMRAIRGVFTNPPAGPLVRHGATHLTVTLTFDDGTVIVWEKGWEKPGRKGKTINRYHLNGKELPNVGRGVPSEIQDLGVREIQAAADKVWPQIAPQFDGTLFLINRSGASVAEALSDVAKVGRLTKALKAADKDRRATGNELKVRRKDKVKAQGEVDAYAGLDLVIDRVKAISKDAVTKPYRGLKEATRLRDRHLSTKSVVEALEGFDAEVVPGAERKADLRKARSTLIETETLNERFLSARGAVETLAGFSPEVPEAGRVQEIQAKLGTVKTFAQKHQAAKGEVQRLQAWSDPSLPDPTKVSRLSEAIAQITKLRDRHTKALDLVASAKDQETEATFQAAEAEALVMTALGERGLCPTCNTVHEGGHHAASRP